MKYISPKSFHEEVFNISKKEEDEAVQVIKNRIGKDGTRVGKYLEKRYHNHVKPYQLFGKKTDEIGYADPHNEYFYIIYKDDKGRLSYRFNRFYSGATLGGETITEILSPELKMTKEDEYRGLRFITDKLLPFLVRDYNSASRKQEYIRPQDEREIKLGLRKIKIEELPNKKIRYCASGSRVFYMTSWKNYKFVFFIHKFTDEGIPQLKVGWVDRHGRCEGFYMDKDVADADLTDPSLGLGTSDDTPRMGVREGIFDKKDLPNLHISKEEEDQMFKRLKSSIQDEHFRKTLRKIEHKVSDNPYVSDVINYYGEYSDGTESIMSVRKDMKGIPYFYLFSSKSVEGKKVPDEQQSIRKLPIDENGEPSNLLITKEEEQRALQYMRKFLIGDKPIGKYLRKVRHFIPQGQFRPYQSDEIDYATTKDFSPVEWLIRIKKGLNGELYVSYPRLVDDYYNKMVINGIDFHKVPSSQLNESTPPGDWMSWGSITDDEKDRLIIILKKYQEYLKKFYVQNIWAPRVYLIQKSIDNFGSSDPRFAAKPLSHLGMENRMFLSDFTDKEDTTGLASRALDFLMELSQRYIEPPKRPKPDIFLKGITRIRALPSRWAGNVTIYGLQDMKPLIDFGYGGFEWSDDFYKKFKHQNELSINFGKGEKVVNMPEVVEIVKKAIEDYYKKNLTEAMDPERYQQALKNLIFHFDKREQDIILNHLQNKIVNGERIGKTLKKKYFQPATQPHDGDIITYEAFPGGKEVFYKVIKLGKHKANVVYYYNDGNGYDKWSISLTEGNDNLTEAINPKRINKRLFPLIKLAKYYDTFDKFEDDYQQKNYHGIYWHLTKDPNFKINLKQSPTDLSSLSSGGSSQPGLMISTHLSSWYETFDRTRKYAAEIDISDLVPDKDYRHVTRGFGHEIYVFKPEGAKVIRVLPIKSALRINDRDYRSVLPQSKEELEVIYNIAHQKTLTENEKPHPILTKEDEQRAVQFIKNLVIEGERAGKTLKKINLDPSRKDFLGLKTSNVFHYQSTIKNLVYDFYFWKIDIDGSIVIIGQDKDTIGNNYYYYHELHGFENEVLSENIRQHITLTREDEQRALQFLRNVEEDGIRLGKTLKKTRIYPTKHPRTSDRIEYTAILPGGKIMRFEMYRSLNWGLIIIDRSDGFEYRLDDPNPIFHSRSALNLKETLIDKTGTGGIPLVLTKEDEKRAVQFISNMTHDNVRFGKTLKKVRVIKSGIPDLSTDTSVYEAKFPDGSIVEFEIFRSWRRGLVIHNKSNDLHYFIDKLITPTNPH